MPTFSVTYDNAIKKLRHWTFFVRKIAKFLDTKKVSEDAPFRVRSSCCMNTVSGCLAIPSDGWNSVEVLALFLLYGFDFLSTLSRTCWVQYFQSVDLAICRIVGMWVRLQFCTMIKITMDKIHLKYAIGFRNKKGN